MSDKLSSKTTQKPEQALTTKPKTQEKLNTVKRMLSHSSRFPSPVFEKSLEKENSYNVVNVETGQEHMAMFETTVFFDNAVASKIIDLADRVNSTNCRSLTSTAVFLHEIAPKDGIEGMLAAQMVASFNLSMEYARRAATADRMDLLEVYSQTAAKFMRLYTSQVDTLSKYRNKGKQSIVVQHVNVNQGGQAVVGNINKGGGDDK